MRILFMLLMVTGALMPSVPELTDPRAIALSIFFAALMASWLLACLNRLTLPLPMAGAFLVAFIALLLMSALTAAYFGTDLALWFRGAIPFLFLLVFFPAYQLARAEPGPLVNSIFLSALVWLIATLVASATAIPQVLSGDVLRITHATEAWSAFQLPYAMVGLALVLFCPPIQAPWIRWTLAFAFSLPPLLAVSRGQILAVAVLWLAYVLLQPRQRRWRSSLVITIVIVALSIPLLTTDVGVSIAQRFSELRADDESSRAAELRYAWAQFMDSPLLGKGLGYPIPAEVTFLGDWETILQAGVDSVGYMHNVIGYLLMTLGMSGAAAYVGFILAGLSSAWRNKITTHRNLVIGVSLALACLLLWFMVQASFRQIQSNLLLANLLAVLAASRARQRQASHA